MSQSADLLRLLEPAVRPVAPVKPTSDIKPGAAGELPFEAQDFDTLLATARQENVATLETPTTPQTSDSNTRPPGTPPGSSGPLDALADFGRIENPGLRNLLAEQHQAADNPADPSRNAA